MSTFRTLEEKTWGEERRGHLQRGNEAKVRREDWGKRRLLAWRLGKKKKRGHFHTKSIKKENAAMEGAGKETLRQA